MKPPIPIAVAASLALACVSLNASTPTHPLTAKRFAVGRELGSHPADLRRHSRRIGTAPSRPNCRRRSRGSCGITDTRLTQFLRQRSGYRATCALHNRNRQPAQGGHHAGQQRFPVHRHRPDSRVHHQPPPDLRAIQAGRACRVHPAAWPDSAHLRASER